MRLGRAVFSGLSAVGACWCAGYLAASAKPRDLPLDAYGDAEVHDEAARGIEQIEAYLAAGDRPVRRVDPKRQRRRDLP
jgi:hypothetical protein